MTHFAPMNIGRLRLANQQVTRPQFDDPAAVVRWLGAVQAQDFLGGLWAIGLRMRGAVESTVEDAIARRAIIRTWPMRGTLHFVAAEDARWMTSLMAPRVLTGAASRFRQLGLDGKVFSRSADVAARVLEGGKCVRRDALYVHWKDAGIATDESRGPHILGYLAQTGVLCFGPRDGKQHTLTLLEEWLPAVTARDRHEALGELARRYFTSHGPATLHDLGWWSGLTLTDLRIGLEQVKDGLDSEEVDGRTFWFAPTTAPRATRTAYLLPAWDEFTVGYRDRHDILDPKYATRVNAGGGVLKPVVVIDGRVVGTWQRTIGKGGVTVTPTFFKRLDPADARAFDAAVDRYARFLGLESR
jgi:hypothetical protein